MHFLHKILVHVPSAIEVDEDTSHEEILDAVKSYARNETECFADQAFDWREDTSAGRWSDEYPQQAYLASEDLEWFMAELDEVLQSQRNEIDFALAQLAGAVGTDLKQIVDGLWNRDDRNSNPEPTEKFTNMTAYYLRCLAQQLYGTYRCDSYFYNTYHYTARLCMSDLREIKENPENWALVMFDYHN